MKKICLGMLFAAFLLAVCFTDSKAQLNIQAQQVVSDLALPNYVANAKDGSNRLFIVLKGGIIKVRQPNGTVTDFLDISSRVLASTSVNGERGLLGMAFHPQYTVNRRFFVYYTRQPDGAIQIAEYKVSAANPNVADTTEKIIITVPHPNFSNHNGGMVEFGPDGYLYFAPGDGGSANDPPANAQNINVLLGKMLRIDINVPETVNPPYAIPPDNPFAGATPGADEIYAYGLRNPFRFSFDRGGTQQMIIADVGQNQIEEIDIGKRGANYGWRVYEGNQCTGLDPQLCAGGATPITHEPPIFTYTHTAPPNNPTRCSITGGYVYRGRRGTFPQGAYLFADYCTGEIWMLNGTSETLLLDTSFLVSSFGEDELGEIYFTTNSTTAGTVQRLVNPNAPTPRNIVADFDGDLRTDVSVFRPSNGTWYLLNSFNNSFTGVQFGLGTDRPTPGDFDGDGKTDVAVFRSTNGTWYVLQSSNNSFRAFQFGQGGDFPAAGDYDGDLKSDFAVFRLSNATWYIWNSSTNSLRAQQWGLSSDNAVPADYDGDGKTDLAVFRQSNATWYILQSNTNTPLALQWGLTTGDMTVPGDYDGDGKFDVAVWRISNGTWYARQSSNGALFTRQWGANGDTPVPGDYDGDGKTDPTVVRNSGGLKTWFITQSFNTATNRTIAFGLDSDSPVPTTDVP